MKELIRVIVQYASRQQCSKTHKRPLLLPYIAKSRGQKYDVLDGMKRTQKFAIRAKNVKWPDLLFISMLIIMATTIS